MYAIKLKWVASYKSIPTKTVERQLYPSYSDIQSRQEKEFDGWFGSLKIGTQLRFVRDDYTWLKAIPISKPVTLKLYYSLDNGDTYTLESEFVFTRFNMEINESENRIELRIETNDKNRELIDGMDKEYDLLDLSPDPVRLKYYKRPLLQIYALGTSRINNYLGGNYWELDTTDVIVNHNELINTYKFGLIDHLVFIQGNSDVLTKDISGRYYSPNPDLDNPVVFYRTDNAYELRIQSVVSSGYRWRVFDLSNGNIIYQTGFRNDYFLPYEGLGGYDAELLTDVDDSSKKVRCFGGRFYGRLLSNLETISGTPLQTLPTDDIVEGISYTYSYPVTDDILAANNLHDVSPDVTRFGKFDSDARFFPGQYFVRQTGANEPYYPLFRSRWTEVSFWVFYTPALRTLQENGSKEFTTEAFTYHSCLNTLLQKSTNGALQYSNDSTYSDFYFGASNPMKSDERMLLVVPITNIIVGEYDQPQKKAITRLSEFMMIPKIFHNCAWFIEDDKIRFEHVRYFRNGKSYTAANIGIDYTTALNPSNGLSWEHGQRQFSYRKESASSRMEWGFLGENSEPFKGTQIDVLDAWVNKGKIDTYKLENFTADLDYVNSQGTSFTSPNAFVVVEAEWNGTEWEVPFADVSIEPGEEYLLQNPYLSMAYLQPLFWRDNAPGNRLVINRIETTALTTRRMRYGKRKLPLSLGLDYMELLKLTDGNALIEGVSKFYEKGYSEYDLLFEIEEV